MIFLKLTDIQGVPVIINMERVDQFRSDGAGYTEFLYADESTSRVKESFEEVEEMLHVALIGNRGVVSKLDVSTVVR